MDLFAGSLQAPALKSSKQSLLRSMLQLAAPARRALAAPAPYITLYPFLATLPFWVYHCFGRAKNTKGSLLHLFSEKACLLGLGLARRMPAPALGTSGSLR